MGWQHYDRVDFIPQSGTLDLASELTTYDINTLLYGFNQSQIVEQRHILVLPERTLTQWPLPSSMASSRTSLQRQNAENLKQIFPEKEYINGIAVAVFLSWKGPIPSE